MRLARTTLESFVTEGRVSEPPPDRGAFGEKRGVFVTLNEAGPPPTLRGCIGFPMPVKPLGEAIQEATVYAASEDPRFPPVASRELPRILVEVSVLTVPEALKVPTPLDLPGAVKVGRDGLVVSRGLQSGLLLPQVATEYKMDSEEFLSQACMKAGLQPDAWLSPGVSVQTFQAAVFGERRPRGDPEPVNI